MASPVVHFEILGKDGLKLQDFYRNLFDWKINADNPMKYGLVDAAAPNSIGGGVGTSQNGSRGMVTVYIQVQDLQRYLDQAEKLGGKTILPPTEIPGYVTIAMFQDPEGNAVGLIKG